MEKGKITDKDKRKLEKMEKQLLGKAKRKLVNKAKKGSVPAIAIIVLVVALAVCAAVFLPKLKGEQGYQLQQKETTVGFSKSYVDGDRAKIPEFDGEDYVVLNDNVPNFNEYDEENLVGESFSELDGLGRCGSAFAKIDRTMMPEGEREGIGQVKPSGFVQRKYEGLVNADPPYLYNRSHLIAYALTGQNANKLNLITGTRYFNATTMLPFEEEVMRYLDHSDNHVLYRVSPLFIGDELVARGVEMEAYSVEDNGAGVCYHVFVYNYQPGVTIDYLTGESFAD